MGVKFSVVIPIFNASAYLRECVDSVLRQTYDQYEIILINDGSTDESFEICKEYVAANRSIQAYTKKNEGLSATRNYGLDVCQGDYIVFLDSDDYIGRESLQKFNAVIEKTGADIVTGYAYHVDITGNQRKSRPFLADAESPMSGTEFFKKSLYQNNMRACAPFYITNKKLIDKYNLRFQSGLYHEDELWTPKLLFYAEKVVDLPFYFYNYRLSNMQSITRDPSKKMKRAQDRMRIACELSDFFSTYTQKQYDCFQDNIAAQYMYAVYDGNFINGEKIVDRFFPLKDAKTRTYIVKGLLFAASPRLACKLRAYKK